MSYTVLIIDDDQKARQNISEYLKLCGYEVFEAGTIKDGKEYIAKGDGDIIVLDIQLPDGNGLELMSELSKQPSRIPVILITGYGNIEMAVDAMKNGAHDFLTKPIENIQNLENSILRAIEVIQMRRELTHLRKNQSQQNNFVVGKSEQFSYLINQSMKAAKASVSIEKCSVSGSPGCGC